MLHIRRVGWLLANYPKLWEQASERRDDLLYRGRQGAFAGGGRGSGHADITGKRGAALGDLAPLSNELVITSDFIDDLTDTAERQLLLTVWRVGHGGLSIVGRCIGWPEWRCREVWQAMCTRLEERIKSQSAGVVSVQPGMSYADGLNEDGREW